MVNQSLANRALLSEPLLKAAGIKGIGACLGGGSQQICPTFILKLVPVVSAPKPETKHQAPKLINPSLSEFSVKLFCSHCSFLSLSACSLRLGVKF